MKRNRATQPLAETRDRGSPSAYGLRDGEGWTYRHGGEFVLKLAEIGQARGLALAEYTTRAGEEPPDHTHGTEDEMFYVLDGSITFRCGGARFALESGGFVFLPRGIQHGYTVAGSDEVRLLVMTSPPRDDADPIGWGGFLGDVESQGELRAMPPGWNAPSEGAR